ncbi:MAG: M28 family peptidase [Clostridiales bacterium]|nr:M28 family peptidase [Clostridiales bacterium]
MNTRTITENIFKRGMSLVLTVAIAAGSGFVLAGCSEDDEKKIPADYGTYGADIARQIAKDYPYRVPYSAQETQAGGFIKDKMEEAGFVPEVQEFRTDSGVSHNYIVKIPGKGYYMQDAAGEYTLQHRIAIIGAHYDSMFDEEGVKKYIADLKAAEALQAETDKKGKKKKDKDNSEGGEGEESGITVTYDGLSDNASGVGCLLTALSQAKDYKDMGYDVYFVAFGAGNSNFAGADFFLKSLSAEERDSIELMYCVDSIYAGSKVYASAGRKSVVAGGNKYELRRKLYKTYDVCYRNTLYSNYHFDICYNESDIYADIDGNGQEELFAEISGNASDYIPFDNAGIPVVYIESFDFNFDTIEEMKDTKNLNLKEYNGMVRNTPLDSTVALDPVLKTEEQDLLQIRINCIAFVMLETIKDGTSNGMTESEYKEFLENQKRGAEIAGSSQTE